MNFTKIRMGLEATGRFKTLKARTGLDANAFCRMGLTYSLANSIPANPAEYDEEGQEISRFTLLGEYEPLLLALVRERCVQEGLDPEADLVAQMRAHMNRGVIAIFNRIRDIGDIGTLLPESARKSFVQQQAEGDDDDEEGQ